MSILSTDSKFRINQQQQKLCLNYPEMHQVFVSPSPFTEKLSLKSLEPIVNLEQYCSEQTIIINMIQMHESTSNSTGYSPSNMIVVVGVSGSSSSLPSFVDDHPEAVVMDVVMAVATSPSNPTGNLSSTTSRWRYPLMWTIVLCIAYSIVFILGLIGNSAVLWVIYTMRHNSQNSMFANCNNVFNYFICNLALADLLVIIFCLLPNLLGNILTTWILGRLICKAVPYLQGVSVSASIYTLVAISIDRFYGIYYPFNNGFSPLVRRNVIAFIWIFSMTITIPWLIYFDLEYTEDNQVMCHEVWPEEWTANFYFLFVNCGLQYLLPVSVIIFFYVLLYVEISRRKVPMLSAIATQSTTANTTTLNSNISTNNINENSTRNHQLQTNNSIDLSTVDKLNNRIVEHSKLKVLKMLIIIVSLFVLSWLPLYIIFCIIKFTQIDEYSFNGKLIIGLTPLAQWLGASNSCVNPILYFFFNPKFRAYLRKTIVKNLFCRKGFDYNQTNTANHGHLKNMNHVSYNGMHYYPSHRGRQVDGGGVTITNSNQLYTASNATFCFQPTTTILNGIPGNNNSTNTNSPNHHSTNSMKPQSHNLLSPHLKVMTPFLVKLRYNQQRKPKSKLASRSSSLSEIHDIEMKFDPSSIIMVENIDNNTDDHEDQIIFQDDNGNHLRPCVKLSPAKKSNKRPESKIQDDHASINNNSLSLTLSMSNSSPSSCKCAIVVHETSQLDNKDNPGQLIQMKNTKQPQRNIDEQRTRKWTKNGPRFLDPKFLQFISNHNNHHHHSNDSNYKNNCNNKTMMLKQQQSSMDNHQTKNHHNDNRYYLATNKEQPKNNNNMNTIEDDDDDDDHPHHLVKYNMAPIHLATSSCSLSSSSSSSPSNNDNNDKEHQKQQEQQDHSNKNEMINNNNMIIMKQMNIDAASNHHHQHHHHCSSNDQIEQQKTTTMMSMINRETPV